jgi:transcription elongation factor
VIVHILEGEKMSTFFNNPQQFQFLPTFFMKRIDYRFIVKKLHDIYYDYQKVYRFLSNELKKIIITQNTIKFSNMLKMMDLHLNNMSEFVKIH